MYHRPTSCIAILTETSLSRVLQGLTPSFWGSLSDSIGRRPVYIMTLSIYVGACIGLALTPTSAYWLLLVLRMVQATGGSAVIAIGSGCVSDIATPGERGKYMGLFSALSMAGPAIVSILP
jgi:MFS family permease